MAIVYEKEYIQGVSYVDGSDIKVSVKKYSSDYKTVISEEYKPPKMNLINLFSKTLGNMSDYPKKYGYFTNDITITLKFFGGTIFIGIIVVLAYMTTRKKYIVGKEHGTSEWGTGKELKRLTARAIRKSMIKDVKKNKGKTKDENEEHQYLSDLEKKEIKETYKREKTEREHREAEIVQKKIAECKEIQDEILKIKNKYKSEKVNVSEKKRVKLKQSIDNDINLLAKRFKYLKGEIEELKEKDLEKRKSIVLRNEVERLNDEKNEKEKEIEVIRNNSQLTLNERKNKIEAINKYIKLLQIEIFNLECKDDVKRIELTISDNTDVILSKTDKISYCQMEGMNNNIMIVGGSGSGKSRGFVLPNILQADSMTGCSYVITDPKGELISKIGRFLELQGYRVRAVNFFEMEKSSGYNCFEYINKDRESFETDVQALINCIIVNTNGGKEDSGGEKFWDNSEKLFQAALFYAVATAFRKEDRNINTVMTLISWLQIEEERDMRNSKLDAFFEVFAEMYTSEHIAVRMFKEFRSKCAGKTAKSIVVTVVARLQKFYAKPIQRITSKDELHLDEIGEVRTALFIIMPPTDTSYNFLAGMVFTQLLQEMNYTANAKYDGRLPIHVKLILDEFANTCTIGGFTQIISYIRSLNASVVPLLQSLSQLYTMYDEKQAKTIFNNCSTYIYLGGLKDPQDLKDISELLGQGTFDEKEYSHSKGSHGSSTISNKKIGRSLLDPAEVGRLNKKKEIIMVTGEKPLYSDKFNYKKHKNYKYTSDANIKNKYIYNPQAIIEEENLKEEKIISLDDYKKIKEDEYRKEHFVAHGEYPNSIIKVKEAINDNMPHIELDIGKSFNEINSVYVALQPVDEDVELEEISDNSYNFESEVDLQNKIEKEQEVENDFLKNLIDTMPKASSSMEETINILNEMVVSGNIEEVKTDEFEESEVTLQEIPSESEVEEFTESIIMKNCGLGVIDTGDVATFDELADFENDISMENFNLEELKSLG